MVSCSGLRWSQLAVSVSFLSSVLVLVLVFGEGLHYCLCMLVRSLCTMLSLIIHLSHAIHNLHKPCRAPRLLIFSALNRLPPASSLAVSLSRSLSLSLSSIKLSLSFRMAASSRIPPIAEPFVSDRAKKTLDLVRCPDLPQC